MLVVAAFTSLAAVAAGDPSAADASAAVLQTPAAATTAVQPAPAESLRKADFRNEPASDMVREVAQWVVQSADNRNLPFILVDKVQARVFVFGADGRLRAATSALMGLAIGDHTVPGIGQKKLSAIRPEERTTPAGRFMASLDKDIHGVEVLWVDYDNAVSLHKVVKGTPQERRAQRLASPSPADKRITYGCINVPVRFYDEVVSPLFKGTYGVVYVLPETRPAREVFNSYAVAAPAPAAALQAAVAPPVAKPAN